MILKSGGKWETLSQIPHQSPVCDASFLLQPFSRLGLWLMFPTAPSSHGEPELHLLPLRLWSSLITWSSPTNKNFAIVFRETRRDLQWAKLSRFLSHFNQELGCTIQYWLCNQKARRNRTQMNYYGKIVLIMGSWSIEIYIYNTLSNYIMQGNKLCSEKVCFNYKHNTSNWGKITNPFFIIFILL